MLRSSCDGLPRPSDVLVVPHSWYLPHSGFLPANARVHRAKHRHHKAENARFLGTAGRAWSTYRPSRASTTRSLAPNGTRRSRHSSSPWMCAVGHAASVLLVCLLCSGAMRTNAVLSSRTPPFRVRPDGHVGHHIVEPAGWYRHSFLKRPFCSTQLDLHPLPLPQAIPHSIDAIKVSQHLGHAFIEAARRSTHRPESEEEELEMQIYNVAPVFTAKDVVMEPSYDGAHGLVCLATTLGPRRTAWCSVIIIRCSAACTLLRFRALHARDNAAWASATIECVEQQLRAPQGSDIAIRRS